MAVARDAAITQLLALQAEVNVLEAEKGKQKQKAEQLLWDKSQPIYERRRQIVAGEKEPSKEELGTSEAKGDDEAEAEAASSASVKDAKGSKGVPNFWLRVLKHQDIIAEQVRKTDEAALAYLEDVRVKKPKGAAGYRVEFAFASNPYFLDKVLWKEVRLESEDLPISAAVLREAPPIKWRKDMNLTVRQVVKKAKTGKGKGKAKEGATTLKIKPTQSFFNFFGQGASKGKKAADIEAEEEDDEEDDDGSGTAAGDVPPLHADMIMAIWNDVVPNAVELYMSEGLSSQGIESEGEDYELVGSSEGEREGLPPSAQRRLRALQFLHQQRVELKQVRDATLRKIDDEFAGRTASLLDRRRFIIVGKERSTEGQALAIADDTKKSGRARFEDAVVPRFWLLALKGCPVTVELIRRADERILAYLADIRATRLSKGLRIDFEFLTNPFIENQVLSRTYTLADDTQVVVETEATPVRWREGVFDITAKKGKGASSKSGSTASFFSLFTKDGAQRVFAADSRTPLTGTEIRDRETTLAFTLRDVVIPRAVDLYQVAVAWADQEEDASASDGDEDTESDGDLDRGEIRRRVKGKGGRGKRRGSGDGSDWTCCGLSRTQALVALTLLIALPQVLYLVDLLFARRS